MTWNRDDPRRSVAAIALATLLGAVLRALVLPADFWLDEIWSIDLAAGLDGWAGVFTGIHHSNNHHLVTLWMVALGPEADPLLHRLPSFLAGVATIPLAAALAWPTSRRAARAAAVATLLSFPLVHFAVEARGYALAVAFALAAQLCLRRALATGSSAPALGFGACVALGLLAHLGFAFYWAGALAQSVWEVRRLAAGRPLRRLVALHALPAVVLAALAWVDLRHLFVGAGNPTDAVALATRTFGFAFGAPLTPWLALPVGALFALGFAVALRRRFRAGDGRWLGDGVTVVLAPALVFAVLQPEVVAVRYFLIGLTLWIVALCELLPEAGLRGRGARVAFGAGALLFVVGNTAHTLAFLEHGRGGFREATQLIAREAGPDAPARVSSDHDFRTGSVLRFYAARLPEARGRIAYVPRARAQRDGVEWWILHAAQRPERPRPAIRDSEGRRFRLVREYDHAAISGFYWALYRSERSSTTVPKPSGPKGSAPKPETRR
ncbi:MAG: hypothetical protein ACQGVC_21395 [Myxococcota bacterium]